MIFANSFRSYSIDQTIRTLQDSTKPVEKSSPTDGNQPKQRTQQHATTSSLDSLGQGRVI